MKIATWNIERLKHRSKLEAITDILQEIDAGILILTETDTQVRLNNYTRCFSTPNLAEIAPKYYRDTETRVSIFTNYKLIRSFETYDKYTSLCVELETERGNLIVYGTIIGIYGNRHKNFSEDLHSQLADIEKLSKNRNFCFAGDYNVSFADNYYFVKAGRDALNKIFVDNDMELLTKDRKECIDHIAVSKPFAAFFDIEVCEWNHDKSLSDHKGIYVDMRG